MIADTFVFSQKFHDHFGAERRFYQLAHDLVFKTVGPRSRSGFLSRSTFGTAWGLDRMSTRPTVWSRRRCSGR
jgi:hypothetical protein